MTRKPPVQDVTDGSIEVGKPEVWAAGVRLEPCRSKSEPGKQSAVGVGATV